jgi:hypothetical protein
MEAGRALRAKKSGKEGADAEQKRCAYRCMDCSKRCHYPAPNAVNEDDPLARSAEVVVEVAAPVVAEAEQRAATEAEDDAVWMSYLEAKKLQYKF